MCLITPTARVIHRATGRSSGHEICADIDIDVAPKSAVNIKTGLIMQMPKRMCASIKGKSSASFDSEMLVFNKIVDRTHRGELKVKLINLSASVQKIKKGDTLGHITFLTYSRPDIVYHTDIVTPVLSLQ
jgi:dUTPase